MMQLISVLSSLEFLFKSILNLFRSFKVVVTIVECKLDKPRIVDDEGGFINGSRVQFEIEIINRKDKKFIISDLSCKAMCKKEVLQDNIYCYDMETCKRIAFSPKYEQLSTIEVSPMSSIRREVVFTSNLDLSNCDKLVFSYKKGIFQRKIVIWNRK